MKVLYYFHDPMCSWCFAFDKVLNQIEEQLPTSIRIHKIVGGLAADSNMPMPESLKNKLQSVWQQIEKTVPHIQFNYDFWIKNVPVRSTYPACRAVLAAKKQSSSFESKMIKEIQQAYYINAENPSLGKTLINCAQRINLDLELFKADFASQQIEDELQKDIQFTKDMSVYSYPSLCLKIDKQIFPITIDYNKVTKIVEQIQRYIGGKDGPNNSK